MGASDAEVVRTLVRGRLPGRLSATRTGDGGAVRHATTPGGHPLVLVRDDDPLAGLLELDAREPAARVQLRVPDVPPLSGSPVLGEARLTGRLRELGTDERPAAALEFAASNPIADLFDVGRGVSMYGIEVESVSIHRHNGVRQVDPAAFVAAEPDPLHEAERDLLIDLSDHHSAEIGCFFRQTLAAAGVTRRATPRAVRLNRYGFVVDAGPPAEGEPGGRWARLEFTRAVRDEHDLGHLLHPVLFHHESGCRCDRRRP